jgi:hypothetical protein
MRLKGELNVFYYINILPSFLYCLSHQVLILDRKRVKTRFTYQGCLTVAKYSRKNSWARKERALTKRNNTLKQSISTFYQSNLKRGNIDIYNSCEICFNILQVT